jgi:hypothetical protein
MNGSIGMIGQVAPLTATDRNQPLSDIVVSTDRSAARAVVYVYTATASFRPKAVLWLNELEALKRTFRKFTERFDGRRACSDTVPR